MNMRNENETKKKVIYTTFFQNENAMYELVFDKISNKTCFFKTDQFEKIQFFVDELETENCIYKPLPADNPLIDKNVILFPSQALPFESEECLLAKIKMFIHKYLEIGPIYEEVATHYVLFSWIYDKFNEVPYLRVIGDFGSGKSRFLQTVGSICYKPIFTAGATTSSPIFRIIDQIHGTLVLDEADFKFSDMSSEMMKILNMGYQKGNHVLRSEGKGVFEVKAYNVYSPKLIATRETFTDKALESRCLTEEMGIGILRKDIPRSLDPDFFTEADEIRNMLLMWRMRKYFQRIEIKEEVIEGVHPRLNQIILPLLAIISDEKARDNLRNFIKNYNTELIAERGLSWESDIIFSILKLEHSEFSKLLTVKEITDETNKDVDNNDEKLTARKVGWYLRSRLQLKPYKSRRGFVLDLNTNKAKLLFWKERFGITDSEIRGVDGECVNVVNNVNVADMFTEIKSDEISKPKDIENKELKSDL